MSLKQETIDLLIFVGQALVDDGENTEYLRGICELIADVTLSEDEEHYVKAMEVARKMGIAEVNVLKMYNLTPIKPIPVIEDFEDMEADVQPEPPLDLILDEEPDDPAYWVAIGEEEEEEPRLEEKYL